LRKRSVTADKAIEELYAAGNAAALAFALSELMREEHADFDLLGRSEDEAWNRMTEHADGISRSPVFRLGVLSQMHVGLVYQAYVMWSELGIPDDRVAAVVGSRTRLNALKGYRDVAFHARLITDVRVKALHRAGWNHLQLSRLLDAIEVALVPHFRDVSAYCLAREITSR